MDVTSIDDIVFDDQCISEEIGQEFSSSLRINETESRAYQNWVAAKAALRGKFIAISTSVKKSERLFNN